MAEYESTGSIAAVIDSYKPADFLEKGGVITIVYEGTIVATIHVREYTDRQASEARYLIRGDDTSLRRFNRLCNSDISNKSDYLRFNDSRAVVPSDLAAAEEHGSFFSTPKRDRAETTFKRFNEFDDMMDALDKAPLEAPGSPLSEPLLRTVYVLVSMHGADKPNLLPSTMVDNKLYILPSGLCSVPFETPSEQLKRLETFRSIPPVFIEDVYHQESGRRIKVLQQNVEFSVKTGKGTDILYTGLSESQKKQRLTQYTDIKLHVGPLMRDREYTHDRHALAFTECISILGSNWKEAEMKTPHGTFTADKTVAAQINDYYAKHSKPPVTQAVASDEFQRFQSLNLLNVEVLTNLTTSVMGYDIPLERFTGTHSGVVDNLTILPDVTGIPHYTNVRLFHLLQLFEKLGFQRVVLFDEGCRTGDMFETSSRASEEAEEADLQPPRGTGGKRTRRKRRLRKSHKKS